MNIRIGGITISTDSCRCFSSLDDQIEVFGHTMPVVIHDQRIIDEFLAYCEKHPQPREKSDLSASHQIEVK